MKTEHQIFEKMLSAKGITKKTFSRYAKIPYYTVAGWKKSDSVPAYAMVILKSMPSPRMITAQQMIDAGLPKAIFWNNDLGKEVSSDIFIVSTLKRAYNDFVVDGLVSFFGETMVLSALERHKEVLSDALINSVTKHIDASLVSA